MTDEELVGEMNKLRGPTVTRDGIEAQIAAEYFIRPEVVSTTLTLCVLVLQNGFHVTGESACVDPANFDEEIGRKISRDNAFGKIWALEGYLLKERLYQAARCEHEHAEGGGVVKLYSSDAQLMREMLLSIRDGIETDVLISDLLPVLDAALEAK